MIWNEFKINTNSEGAAFLEEALAAIGVVGIATTDPAQLKKLLEDKVVPWDYVDEALLSGEQTTISFYLSDSEADREMAKKVRELIESMKNDSRYGEITLAETKVDDSAWADNWKQYFKPLEIGNRLVIRPSWETYENKGGKVVLEIDPASSFGTGQHETTALCLEALEAEIDGYDAQRNAVLLDMGCGSGILGLAGLLLAPDNIKFAIGVDIDENAVNTALENAVKNNVADKYKAFYGDVVANRYLKVKIKAEAERAGASKGFDIILANIVADVLISMAETLLELAAPGAAIVCSGIIAPKSDAVKAAFTARGAVVDQEFIRNDWAAIVIRKQK